MKIRSCRFERSAFREEDEPRAPGPDVTFLGRSNVGKSSLINRLLGTKGLARTSSQPGRTQSANFYRVNDRVWLIDLPGYGFARVPRAVRESWGTLVEGLLERRRGRIALALLVVDSRRNPTELDQVMRDWLEAKEIPYMIVATKADKLKAAERARAARRLTGDWPGVPTVLASAVTGQGVREVWTALDQAIETTEAKER